MDYPKPFNHHQSTHIKPPISSQQSNSDIDNIINKISHRIDESQVQWKNMRFANIEGEDESQQNIQQQYNEWFQKYRGKKGDVKSIGLILYFKFLIFVMILFTILTLSSLPTFVFNYQGNGIKSFKNAQFISSYFLLFSLPNQKYYQFHTLSNSQINNIKQNKNIVIINDLVNIIIILIGILIWKIKSYQIIGQYIEKSPPSWLYVLQIKNLPVEITVSQLEKHFKYYGKINQIQPIRQHKSNLMMMKSIVRLIYRHKLFVNNTSRQKQIKKKIYNLYKELGQSYLSYSVPKIKSALIAFENISTRNYVFQLYKYNINPPKLKIKNILPKVSKCRDQPLTINWENYHLQNHYHTKRNICQCVFLILMIFLIVIALFILNLNSSYIKTVLKKQKEGDNMLRFQDVDIRNKLSVDRFCSSINLQSFKWSYYQLCTQYLEGYKHKFMLMLLFSLLVVFINFLTNQILRQLVQFRRYKTIAQKNSFLIIGIFLFSLFNSGILIVLMRGKYISPILSSITSKLLNLQNYGLVVQNFDQFNRKWYLEIGSQLILNYIITVIISPHFYIILHAIRTYFRRKKQQIMKKQIKDPDFNYCTFYAISLKSIFFSLFYSQSMPILYPLTIISTIVQYYIAKSIIKRYVREPIFFDTTSNQTVIKVLPYSLVIHTFFSIIFFNVNDIFPIELPSKMKPYDWIFNFMKFKQGYIHTITLGTLILFIFYHYQIYKLVIEYWQPLKLSYSKTFSQLARNPSFLSSYRMKDNPKYKIIAYAMELFENHIKTISEHENFTQMQLINTHNFKLECILTQPKLNIQDVNSYSNRMNFQ